MTSSTPPRALVLAAHPDDADFRCAGTVAGWVEEGCTASLVVVTDGSKGSHDLTLADQDVADRREQEQRRAATIVGYAHVDFLGEVDGMLDVDEGILARIVRLLRERRPTVVISYDGWAPYQLHPDHSAVGQLAFLACIRSREPRFYRDTSAPDSDAWPVTHLWLFGAPEPDHVVDISRTIDRKITAILCHETQYPTEMGFAPGDEIGRQAFEARIRAMAARTAAEEVFGHGEDFKILRVG